MQIGGRPIVLHRAVARTGITKFQIFNIINQEKIQLCRPIEPQDFLKYESSARCEFELSQ